MHYPHAAEKAAALHHLLHQPHWRHPRRWCGPRRACHSPCRAAAHRVRQVAAYDQEIARLFLQHHDHAIFASLPGAGKRLAPRLLAEWGEDRGHYLDAASVQSLAATAPVVFQSGAYRGVRRRRPASIRSGRRSTTSPARAPCWRLGQSLLPTQTGAGKDAGHGVAGVGQPVVRILYAMWLHSAPYDPAFFAAARRAHSPVPCRLPRGREWREWRVTCLAPEAARPAPLGRDPSTRRARGPSGERPEGATLTGAPVGRFVIPSVGGRPRGAGWHALPCSRCDLVAPGDQLEPQALGEADLTEKVRAGSPPERAGAGEALVKAGAQRSGVQRRAERRPQGSALTGYRRLLGCRACLLGAQRAGRTRHHDDTREGAEVGSNAVTPPQWTNHQMKGLFDDD